jgi:hypothetical protein
VIDSAFFQSVSDIAPIRQGDVIQLDARGDDADPFWGVIVTADCDIAQEKMGEFYTYLRIATAREYVERIWASEELAKASADYGAKSVQMIQDIDRKRDTRVHAMQVSDLINWIREDGAELVADVVQIVNPTQRKKAVGLFKALALTDEREAEFETPLARLTTCWSHAGKSPKDQKSQIENALNHRKMRGDFMFIPTLPNEKRIGFVVLMRDIRSILKSDLYLSRLSLKIAKGEPGFYRIGRFSDFIRYAIAQKMAFLFSRIGMTEVFESEADEAISLVIDSLPMLSKS